MAKKYSQAKSGVVGGLMGVTDIGAGILSAYLVNKYMKDKYKDLVSDKDLREDMLNNPSKYKQIPVESLPSKSHPFHNENINEDLEKYSKGKLTKNKVGTEIKKNREHLFAKGTGLVDFKKKGGDGAISHPFTQEMAELEDQIPVLPAESYHNKTFSKYGADRILKFKGGYQDYMDETQRSLLLSEMGLDPYERANLTEKHKKLVDAHNIRTSVLGRDVVGPPPESIEAYYAKQLNEALHEAGYQGETLTGPELSMQHSPIYGNNWSLYKQPELDTKAMDEWVKKESLKTAAYGGDIPRYSAGGYRIPQYAGGGMPGMQQAMTADMARAANVGGQYQQEIMRELMGEGQQSEHPVDYRTRMMMESFVGRDPANPTMGSSAQQAQQQQMMQQQQQQPMTMSANGVADPTGQLFQDPGYDPMQQAQQQQSMNDAVRSKIPYYQQAYQKALQHSQNPKGAMRNIMPPKTRMQ